MLEPKPVPKTDSKSEHDQIAQPALIGANGTNGSNGANGNGFAHPQPPNPARPETAHVETSRVSLPRLSELRGMGFSQALRELDRAKRTAPANPGLNLLNGSLNSSLNDALDDRQNGALADRHNDPLDDALNDPISEALLSAIAPFEPMFAPAASAPAAQNGATAMSTNGAQGPSQQVFFPTKPPQPDRRRSRREEKDRRSSPREPKAPGKEANAFLDQLQILPSRRGQYKKKG